MKRLTPDQVAMRLLLDGDDEGLRKLYLSVQRAIGLKCPECDGTNIQDNYAPGITADEWAFICDDCDFQWDANPV